MREKLGGIWESKPTHPGEVLLEDVIKPLGLTITEAAGDLGVSRKALYGLVNGRCGLNPESWLYMQTKLDLWTALQKEPVGITGFPVPAAG
jgi:plasmid maintenance system antidote protein VapI